MQVAMTMEQMIEKASGINGARRTKRIRAMNISLTRKWGIQVMTFYLKLAMLLNFTRVIF